MLLEEKESMRQRKRKRGKNVLVEETDILSNLPDGVLHHILSFFDTRSMVQTSILSRRWRCLWKDAPAITFRRSCFNSEPVFRQHVIRFLSLRSSHASVRRINLEYHFPVPVSGEPVVEVFDGIMKYATSHGKGGHLHHLSLCSETWDATSFTPMAASIMAYRHHESLTTLELAKLHLTSPPSSSFISLTTLKLLRCHFFYLDPFADFPCLKYLKLFGCRSSVALKVSGLQLLDLDIRWADYDVLSGTMEVFAPKLKSLRFVGDEGSTGSLKLNVPTLNHANIRLQWWTQIEFLIYESMDETNHECVSLLRCLHNVESLILCFDNWVAYDVQQYNSILVAMKSVMEVELSPFTRLKTLKLQYREGPISVPYEVIRYFLDGSRSNEKSFVLEKI
ncbi:FBD-associated F-box protein At1g66310 [Linum grandiflorum]